MTRLNKTVCLVFFFCIAMNSWSQENLMDFENSLKFARYLKTTRQLTFAAQEYERLNYLWPNDSAVVLELVQTYRLNQQCDKFFPSVQLLSNNNRLFQNPSFSREYLRYSLTCRIKDNVYFDLLAVLKSEETPFYTASYYWVNREYDLLFAYSKKEKELFELNNLNLYQITKEFSEQNYKSPALAAMMSAIVPGSGKAYTKRWGDAFVSFLFIGTNAYAAYRAFHKKGAKSANGWIFGGLAFSFYSANIWGSAKAAKNYNTHLKETYQNNAENIIYNSF